MPSINSFNTDNWLDELTKDIELKIPSTCYIIKRMAIFPLILIAVGIIIQIVVYCKSDNTFLAHDMDYLAFCMLLTGCVCVLSNAWKYAIVFMSLPASSENTFVNSLIEARRFLFLTLTFLSGLHSIISLGLLITPAWSIAPMTSVGILFLCAVTLAVIVSILKAQLTIMLANSFINRER